VGALSENLTQSQKNKKKTLNTLTHHPLQLGGGCKWAMSCTVTQFMISIITVLVMQERNVAQFGQFIISSIIHCPAKTVVLNVLRKLFFMSCNWLVVWNPESPATYLPTYLPIT